MTDKPPHRCIACCEPIRSDARLCHHCGTSQKKRFWAGLGGVLKWVGGFTAVLSLVAGSVQLNSLYKDWQKKESAVDNYLIAARHQLSSGDFESAQLLLQEAVKLAPASNDVRDLQIDFLMKELRMYYSIYYQSREADVLNIYYDDSGHLDYTWGASRRLEEIREYLKDHNANELMALGVATSSGARKADILAHIAWVDIVLKGTRNNTEIEKLFNEALQIDAANPYVHLFQSAWMTNDHNGLDSDEKLAVVLDHFSAIGEVDNNIWPWVKSMQFKILLGMSYPQADIEMLRLVEKYNDEPLFPSVASDILYKLNKHISDYDREGQQKENENFLHLQNAYSDAELLMMTIRLGEIAFGCTPGQQCSANKNFKMKLNYYYIMGFLYERSGEYKKSLDAYRMYQWESTTEGYSVKGALLASLKRAMASNNIAATSVMVVRESGSKSDFLKTGDLIFKYNGYKNISRDRIRNINKTDSDKTNNFVDLLRDAEHHTINIGNASITDLNAYKSLTVPMELISNKTDPERIKQLYEAWVGK